MEFRIELDHRQLARKVDKQGFLRSKARIARVGIQEYAGYGKVYRSASTLVKAIDSINNQLIVNEHPGVDVNSENAKELNIGFLTNVRYQDGWLVGHVVITDSKAVGEAVSGEKLEFSLGYDCTLRKCLQGSRHHMDKQYDYEVVDIQANHLALVPEARAGHDATFTDSKTGKVTISNDNDIIPIENTIMPKAIKEQLADSTATVAPEVVTTVSPEVVTTVAPEVVATVAPEVVTTVEPTALKDNRDDLISTLQAKIDILELKLKDAADVKPVVIDLTGEEIAARVEAWAFVQPKLNDSKDVDYGMTVSAVRKLLLEQELPNLVTKLSTATDAYINGLWDAYQENFVNKVAPEPVAVVVPVTDAVDTKEADKVTEAVVEMLNQPLADSVSSVQAAQNAYIARLTANAKG